MRTRNEREPTTPRQQTHKPTALACGGRLGFVMKVLKSNKFKLMQAQGREREAIAMGRIVSRFAFGIKNHEMAKRVEDRLKEKENDTRSASIGR